MVFTGCHKQKYLKMLSLRQQIRKTYLRRNKVHKKIVALFALIALVCGAMFADVAAKALDGDKVEITFSIKAPASQLVVITGPSPFFPNWNPDGIPMVKDDQGVWSYKLTAKKSDTIVYKFLLDGAWLADPKAPDYIDDGFGGRNGTFEVASLVSSDSAAPVAKKGPKFQTWSMLGVQAKYLTVGTFDTTQKGMDLDSVGIGLKSYWKFSGYAVDKVPVYVEVALAENDGFANIFAKDSEGNVTLKAKDGFKHLFTDLLFDPVAYFNKEVADGTYLGHFKTGFESDYVNWTTGYKYAKLPPHTNVSWTTVDKEWEAGYAEVGGFNIFDLGPALRQIGDSVTINATIAPNRSADRAGNQYGLYTFVNAQTPVGYFDVQYNGAYGTTFDTLNVRDNGFKTDVIFGYKGTFGPITAKVNALMNKYEATNVQVTYTADMFDATLGFRTRGASATMMYVEEGADDHTNISDQLGDPNKMKFWLDANVTPIEMLTIGANVAAEKVLDTEGLSDKAKSLMELTIAPKVTVKLDDAIGIESAVAVNAEMNMYTNDSKAYTRGSVTDASFLFKKAGLKYTMGALNDAIGGIDVLYSFQNTNASYLFNTLLAEVKLPMGITAQAGCGLRSANKDVADPTAPFGAFLGAWKKLDVLQKPILYTQFVYNMDPYKAFGDGQEVYNLDGYILDGDDAVNNYAGAAAIRLALRWEI